MKKDIERRIVPTELRVATGENGQKRISGHAAVFNSLSEEMWGFREEIAPGAFKECIATSDIRSLINHDPNLVLGRMKAGTLTVSEDARGLYIENTLPDTSYARDLAISMERGDIDQMSFGFRVGEDSWESREGKTVRVIKRVDELFDISPVTYPAYPDTSVALRSMEAWKNEKREAADVIMVPADEPKTEEPLIKDAPNYNEQQKLLLAAAE
jgi:uncharacterized protein